ncbi:hypothetical protein MMC17_010203 [Xylographa soralifera]|nr:hypothetical protein [Xylographa soralifera]
MADSREQPWRKMHEPLPASSQPRMGPTTFADEECALYTGQPSNDILAIVKRNITTSRDSANLNQEIKARTPLHEKDSKKGFEGKP